MRTLIISDIHGNFAALEAVERAEALAAGDEVICLGDIVGYGPEPGACLRWVAERAEVVVQGNHDRALAEDVPPGCRAQFEWLARETAPIGRAQAGPRERSWLATLPRWAFAESEGTRYLFVHATPAHPLYRYLGPDPSEWAQETATLDADAAVVGHTHLPFEITVAGRRIINPGSVGQPKDGDPRAAYAVLERGVVRFGRASYDVERTIAGLAAAGVAPAAVAALGELLRTGRTPPAAAPPVGAHVAGSVMDT